MKTTKTLFVVSAKDDSNTAQQLRDKLDGLEISLGITIDTGYYMHGKLEEHCGYDICDIVNWDELEYDTVNLLGRPKPYAVLEPGIYDVKVLGVDKPCVGYFWRRHSNTINNQRGLICFKGDKEAVKYAEECYREQSITI